MVLHRRNFDERTDRIRVQEMQRNEDPYHQRYPIVVGVDEVGRGPLAGPVYAACVVLPRDLYLPKLNDSKKLSEDERFDLADLILRKALYYSYGYASVEEIDRLNILQASMLAMQRAVSKLPVIPDFILVDGNKLPLWEHESLAIIGGDGIMPSIAAASIIAKAKRDHLMRVLAEYEPRYGFERHKGYGTKMHYEALEAYGPSILHRMTFLKGLAR